MFRLLLMQFLCAWIFAVVHYALKIDAAQPIVMIAINLGVVLPGICLLALIDIKPDNGRTWLQCQIDAWCELALASVIVTAIGATALIALEYRHVARVGYPTVGIDEIFGGRGK
jgi:hypothetical protein